MTISCPAPRLAGLLVAGVAAVALVAVAPAQSRRSPITDAGMLRRHRRLLLALELDRCSRPGRWPDC